MNTKITRQQFTAFCNKTWDILGLEVLANEYIEYILLLLFLKRISDVFEEENEFIVQNQIKSGKSVVDGIT
jgi:type I restriction enzyme M protein